MANRPLEKFQFMPVRDIEFAAVITLLGVKSYEPAPITRLVQNGQEICAYNFVPDAIASEAGREWQPDNFETLKQVQLPDIRTTIAIAKFVFMNRSRMLDEIRRHAPLHKIERNGKTYLVTKK